jgi:hypothetical protein
MLAGCAQRRIEVAIDMTQGGAVRSFSSNALGRADLDRLRSVYGSEPTHDAAVGGQRFTGSFGAALPSEVGNRNGLASVTTSLGSAGFYYESFAEPAPIWSDLRSRMDAGELWVRLFGRWAERNIDGSAAKEAWRRYVDRELVPLVCDAVLLWAVQSATARYTRVEQTLREVTDAAPLSEDERFVQRVGMPLLLLLAERGILTADETQRLLLIFVDGRFAPAERDLAVETIFKPAVLRQIQRFRPQMQSLDTGSLVAMGLSFWLFATTSPERNDLLLASNAISDEDKAAVRAGRSIGVRLPPPFGFDPMRGARPNEPPTRVEVRLRVAGDGPLGPSAHNGRFHEERGELVFATTFTPPDRRVTLFPPVFYASWAEPDTDAQRSRFGSVVLTGAELAAYVAWAEGLQETQRIRWESALDRLADGDAIDELVAIERETRAERPMPASLVAWIEERSGRSR